MWYITQLDGPTIAEDPQKVYKVHEGGQVELICGHNLASYPTPEIIWISPHKKQINNSKDYAVSNQMDKVQLTILNVNNVSDSGEWMCVIKVLKISKQDEQKYSVKNITLHLTVVGKFFNVCNRVNY